MKMKRKRLLNIAIMLVLLTVLVFLTGCSAMMASMYTDRATIGYGHTTSIHQDLISLPEPEEKIVVAAYKFRDQTGQYKPSATATTFSTAVTQGATSMLIKALEDSNWFIPIEREGLPNLLNERQIIRSTRMQHQSQNENEEGEKLPPLPALFYAGVLLEGGVIAYDTDLVTGGLGVRYFGLGGSGEFRRDQVTVYLRAVSVKTGKILKSVSVTKSILSREVGFGLYRFVRIKRLLELETGLSTNEPPSMCVLEATEKAVHDLIIEGILDGIWQIKGQKESDISTIPAIKNYLEEKEKVETVIFDKKGNLKKVDPVEKK